MTLFALSGLTSGIAGAVVAVQYFSIDANRGVGWELIAIAMAVIGGTLLTGGYGSVLGTVLGAFMYAMVNDGLLLVGLQGYWVNIFLGVVVLVAVLINRMVIDRFVILPIGPRSNNRSSSPMRPDCRASRPTRRRRDKPTRSTRRRRNRARRRATRRHDDIPIGDGAARNFDRGPRRQGAGSARRQRRRQEHADQGALGRLPTHVGFGRGRRAHITLHSADHARAAGISTVFQDLAVCDLMSISRNMVLGNEPLERFGPLRIYDAKAADRIAKDALATLGVDLRRRLSDPRRRCPAARSRPSRSRGPSSTARVA